MKILGYDMSPPKGVVVSKIKIPGKNGNIPALVVCKKGVTEPAPGVLWIHGGGYATGMKEMLYMGRGIDLALRHGAVVISPSYTLSFKAPYPAAIDDCYDVLKYIKEHTAKLGIRDDQIMVGGESAGGGLTASLCMMARDRKEVNIAYQMPLYPMLDDHDTESSRDNHAKVWNTRRNHMAWRMYLKGIADKDVSVYAAPARQTDYSGLPPAYTFVCTAEPFYCETMTFIDNLKKAGVEAAVDVYEGLYHAFDMNSPKLDISKEAIERFNERFAYAKEHYFAEQTGDKT